jgi:predicted nuclease with TOPRIM domain
VRRPLEEKKAELEKEISTGEGEMASKTMELKDIRQQLQQSREKLRVREGQAWTLETDLKELSSRPKRSSYVHRITELVKNSQKQETDIAKIITDTRALQRDGNATNDRLRRTYALVDELVFRDAKKDPVCRQSYRQLTTIHETFADIVDKVLEMDKTGRDIAELQAQLEELQKSSLDVQSVQADLDAVAIETRALERRLTMVQASTHRNILISA